MDSVAQTVGDSIMNKIQTLADDWGYSSVNEMIESCGLLATPAICMNNHCNYTSDVEPDQSKGWCDRCHTKTVTSCLVLAGVM